MVYLGSMEMDFITKNGRKLYAAACTCCGKRVYRRLSYIKRGDTFTCSRKCNGLLNTRGSEVACAQCGAPTYKQPHEIKNNVNCFCSLSCSAKFNNKDKYADGYHPNYIDGYSSYRSRALRHHGHQCMNPDCKLKNFDIEVTTAMLDVDHINDDRSDNRLENLKVLCVWCHAEKTRKVTEKLQSHASSCNQL